MTNDDDTICQCVTTDRGLDATLCPTHDPGHATAARRIAAGTGAEEEAGR